VNALSLDTLSAPDGTVTVQLPEPGRFHVHVQVTWEPAEPDVPNALSFAEDAAPLDDFEPLVPAKAVRLSDVVLEDRR
jgi:hypothetical protein